MAAGEIGGKPTLTRILGVWVWLPDGRDGIERTRQEGPALSGDGPPGSGEEWGSLRAAPRCVQGRLTHLDVCEKP